jgi:methylmalonyl-CoA mutase
MEITASFTESHEEPHEESDAGLHAGTEPTRLAVADPTHPATEQADLALAHLDLASEFDTASRSDWLRMVNAVMQRSGAITQVEPPDAGVRALRTLLPGGIQVQPLYTAVDSPSTLGYPGVMPFVRGSRALGSSQNGWDIRQRHADPDPAKTRKMILDDLAGGVSSLWLEIGPDRINIDDLDTVLREVYIDLAQVVLDAGPNYEAAAAAFFAISVSKGIAPEDLLGNLGADPLGTLARTGDAPDCAAAAQLARRCVAGYAQVCAWTVDSLVFHEAGCSDVEEIAFATATGLEYLRAMQDAGLEIDDACRQIEFRFAASADQFTTIAKLRAARRVWSRVLEVCGVSPALRGQGQHAVTAPIMMTQRDPWVNILRTTTACFAAGVGGAGSVTVLPFDAALGLPDDFARRIARNTQAILIEESHVAQVVDPAGGSWYVEHLTEDFAQAAWDAFTRIESAGGMLAELKSGAICERVTQSRVIRQDAVARRIEPVTGVSEFPLYGEKLLTRPAWAVTASGEFPVIRLAQPFEQLRDRSDAHAAQFGNPPRVQLRAVDTDRAHRAVLDYAAGTFALAGFEVLTGESDGTPDITSVCLIAADQPEEVRALVESLDPSELIVVTDAVGDSLMATEVMLFPGCDVVSVLAGALDQAGVK